VYTNAILAVFYFSGTLFISNGVLRIALLFVAGSLMLCGVQILAFYKFNIISSMMRMWYFFLFNAVIFVTSVFLLAWMWLRFG